MMMALPEILQSIVDFVRKGYPQGVPQQDYIPLIALLARRLTDEEIATIAADLTPADGDARVIGAAIQRLGHESASDADIERVRDRLKAAGWEPETSS
jgi:Protein of unknown function (DUF3349)